MSSIMPSMDGINPNWTTGKGIKDDNQQPGYRLEPFVKEFIETGAGKVPVIDNTWSAHDWQSTVLVRTGFRRHQYTVSPGLYAVGKPDSESEVLVTANFKLTFNHLRKCLDGVNAWVLVLDTKGVNVWCAAGKGTFATQELVARIQASQLHQVVSHKRVIVPQLGATGVSARQTKAACGFRVIFGPVRMNDIPEFLENKRTVTPDMRKVTFTLKERLILTPVELWISAKPALFTLIGLVILSGFGPGIFSFNNMWPRWFFALFALLSGMIAGAVITPALLPIIPFRAFAPKGFFAGGILSALLLLVMNPVPHGVSAMAALFIFSSTVSSFLAMNFTGATPYTSPSGVEKEMKQYMPVQLLCVLISAGLWIYSSF